jgi:hypothetical protein
LHSGKIIPLGINPPGGMLGEYIPFYFGPLSPMLLNIATGYRGIQQRPQSEIVYICCAIDDIEERCTEWCFTDGHAKNNITEFYNDLQSLDQVDWDIVGERYWHNTEEDYDRMRRKQAEFLVKEYVPAECISEIVVFDGKTLKLVQKLVKQNQPQIAVSINSGYYY